jgi:hypothetical protein
MDHVYVGSPRPPPPCLPFRHYHHPPPAVAAALVLDAVLQITEARAQNSKNALARRALAARARANP